MKKPMSWCYGVTTVPQRLDTLFRRTLASLTASGFDQPHLFIDGSICASDYQQFGLNTTTRYPAVRIVGNWIASLWELYARNPVANRFAIFQDDIVVCCDLRQYLERCEYPHDGYLNLCTYPQNQALAPEHRGWYLSNQMGRGAQALVFSAEAVRVLLSQLSLVNRMQDTHRGYRAVDGAISVAFKQAGWHEYVHNPSLVYHTGTVSTLSNRTQPMIESFSGENFSALDFIRS